MSEVPQVRVFTEAFCDADRATNIQDNLVRRAVKLGLSPLTDGQFVTTFHPSSGICVMALVIVPTADVADSVARPPVTTPPVRGAA